MEAFVVTVAHQHFYSFTISVKVRPATLVQRPFSRLSSGRCERRVSALHGRHALGGNPRRRVRAAAAGRGRHLLLCQQMWPHHVSLWQIGHRDKRAQLGGGQGRLHVSIGLYIYIHVVYFSAYSLISSKQPKGPSN